MTTGLPAITCPACQTEMGLEAILGADDARGVVEILARMPGSPSLRKGLLRYVGLFAPAKQRLRWGRVESLLAEVLAMIETGRIERNGRTWPAPLDYWQMAIDAVLANAHLRRPLKSHGYLLEILAGLADKAEGRAEHDRLTQGRGETPIGGVGAAEAAKPRANVAAATAPTKPRTPMPQSVKEILNQAKGVK